MDTHIGATSADLSTPRKRNQNYLRFKRQPSDAALMAALPERQRHLLQSEGSYKETAEKLGLPIGTVRSGLHRARAALERLRGNSQSGADISGPSHQ